MNRPWIKPAIMLEALVFALIVWVGSHFIAANARWYLGGNGTVARVGCGVVSVCSRDWSLPPEPVDETPAGVWFVNISGMYPPKVQAIYRADLGIFPGVSGEAVGKSWEVSVRLFWVPLLITGGIALQLVLHRRKENRPISHCPHCGYDCRATPGRCSECGWVVDGMPDIAAGKHSPTGGNQSVPPRG